MSDDRGTVAIVVALFLTALAGVAALTIDVGAMLVEHRALQNGADAAAIAIAQDCVASLASPPGPTPCDPGAAQTTATTYFAPAGTMFGDSASASVDLPTPTYDGKVGVVTVVGETDLPPIFASFLGVDEPLDVAAAARARWGPVTALDTAFPLVVCDGALPSVDVGPDTLVVPDPGPGAPNVCDGAPLEQSFGWTPPDDPAACTTAIGLLPATTIDVDQADAEPTSAGCLAAIDDLHDAIDSGNPADRTRVLAVYDPDAGSAGARPAYALIGFEFTGAHFGGRTSHASPGSWSPACDVTDPTVRCIEGTVRAVVPTLDGPIVDPTVETFPGMNDSTVLDVRLVE